ncbi:MAG TPA: MFS transporter [Anaerolineaceae bacterium]|nr:MFS transporter [Anaerolineaceae bacterium]
MNQTQTHLATQSHDRRTTSRQTVLYYLGFIALGMATAAIGPTIEGLARHTHSQLSEISILFTVQSLGYLIGSSQIGKLYDRVPSHFLMAAGLLGMVVMMALLPIIPILWVLMIAIFFLGIAAGILDLGGNTLLVWVHGDRVGPFMNGLHLFFGIGSFIAPIIVSRIVLVSGDITLAYWALAALMVPTLAGLLIQPGPKAVKEVQSKTPAHIQPMIIAVIAVLFFLFVGAEVGYGGWIHTYAVKQNLGGETTAAVLNSAFWGALTAGRFVGIPIAARIHPRWILLGDLFVAMTGCTIAVLNPNSLAATWAATLLVGLGIASLFPSLLALAEHSLALSARVMSWFFVGSSLGGLALPWLIGQMIEPVGAWTMMGMILADLVIGLITLGFLLRLLGTRQPVQSQAG